jgi:uncharacterized membrane protein HdeD (DUF308 family)
MWFASSRTLILRGLVTMAFGLAVIAWPTVSFEAFVLLFGAFALVEGALILLTSTRPTPDGGSRTAAVVGGILGVAIGISTFIWPGITLLALLWLIAVRALIVGVVELSAAAQLGAHVSLTSGAVWLLAAAGFLSVVFGAVLLLIPGAGLVAVMWAIGFYALLLGAMLIARAWVITRSIEAA